jgi:beta-N-acetylhexosaminidase
MDLRDFGNLFLVGFPGTRLNAEVKEFLDALNPAGVILFARNIDDPIQVSTLNHDMQLHAAEKMDQRFFIGVDQEGGRVRRLKEPFTAFPSARELASSPNPEQSIRDFASVTSREIRLAGFNLNFVPVLDVLAQTENAFDSVIGDRAFGSDSEAVAHFGRLIIETMRASGVIPCGKHFPGHGGTSVDSHTDLPVDRRDLPSLEAFDLVPFRRAIDVNVEMVMTAHVLYASLDNALPGTLSPRVVDGILRRHMGFDGVVATDDLDMGAVADRYSVEECAMLAVAAGVDLLLICNEPSKSLSARDRLFQAVENGEIAEARIQKSLGRVRQLKTRYEASMQPCDVGTVRDYFAGKIG